MAKTEKELEEINKIRATAHIKFKEAEKKAEEAKKEVIEAEKMAFQSYNEVEKVLESGASNISQYKAILGQGSEVNLTVHNIRNIIFAAEGCWGKKGGDNCQIGDVDGKCVELSGGLYCISQDHGDFNI